MSLVLWLPLCEDGNNENLGIGPASVQQDTTVFEPDGPLGGCRKNSASTRQYLELNETISSYLEDGSSFSFAIWARHDENSTTGTGVFGCNQYRAGGFGLIVSNTSFYNFQLMGTSTGVELPFGKPVAGKWTHIACTYDSDTHLMSCYLDGELVKTYTTTFEWTSNTQRLRIGYATQGGWTNCVNYVSYCDFRLYDHCLSHKEVRRITEPMILHYKLDDPDVVGGVTNLNNIARPTGASSFWNTGGVYNKKVVNIDVPGIPSKEAYYTEFSAETGTLGVSMPESYGYIQVSADTTYTFSVFLKTNANKTYSPRNRVYTTQASGTTTLKGEGLYYEENKVYIGDGWYRIYGTVTTTSATTKINFGTYVYPLSGETGYLMATCPMIELGDTMSEYVSGTSVADIIYDSSGLHRNAPANNNVKIDKDSARYHFSTFLSGNTNISSPEFYENDNMTYSAWFKTKRPTNNWYILDCRHKTSAAGIQPIYYSGTYFQTHSSPSSTKNYPYSLSADTWYHVATVVTPSGDTIYVNGELLGSSTVVKTVKGRAVQATVGARLSNNMQFTGSISDVRIYGRALTAEEVKELYNVGGSIDNKGNVYSYKFIEN